MTCIPEFEDHGGLTLALQAVMHCPLCTELLYPRRASRPEKQCICYIERFCVLNGWLSSSCSSYLAFADVASKLVDMLQGTGLRKLF